MAGELQSARIMDAPDKGYSIRTRVFEPAEMQRVLADLGRASIARTRAGARHVLGVPAVRAIASHPRLMEIASGFVGPSPVPFRATLFDKSQASNWLVVWHQDRALPLRSRVDDPAWGPWSAKSDRVYAHAPAWALNSVIALRVHLDDSTVTNGPLRVLPGTHQMGVLTDAAIERLAREITAVDCVAGSGSVVAMRPLIVHASSKARDDRPRRVLHVEYAAAVRLAGGIELAVG